MGAHWLRTNTLTGVEKGIDFILHFKDRPFTMIELAERYSISRRQAYRLVRQAETFVDIVPDGFRPTPAKHGCDLYLWRIKRREV